MTEHVRKMDPRDRLLAALFAQLRSERETRDALAWAIRSGATSPEVLEAWARWYAEAITSTARLAGVP